MPVQSRSDLRYRSDNIGSQAIGQRQAVHIGKDLSHAVRVGGDIEGLQLRDKLCRLFRDKRAVVLRAGEHGARLVEPQNWHYRRIPGRQLFDNSIRIRMRCVLETPSRRDGVIEDEGRHARP